MLQVANTGFLVAYWSKADAHHRWARRLRVAAPLRTCEAVFDGSGHLLGTTEPLLQMLVDGDLTAEFHAETHAADLLRWLEKFADQDPGFADACVVKLGELASPCGDPDHGSRGFYCLSHPRGETFALRVSAVVNHARRVVSSSAVTEAAGKT